MIQTWLKTARVGSSSNPGWVSLRKLCRAGGTVAGSSVSSSGPGLPPVLASGAAAAASRGRSVEAIVKP